MYLQDHFRKTIRLLPCKLDNYTLGVCQRTGIRQVSVHHDGLEYVYSLIPVQPYLQIRLMSWHKPSEGIRQWRSGQDH